MVSQGTSSRQTAAGSRSLYRLLAAVYCGWRISMAPIRTLASINGNSRFSRSTGLPTGARSCGAVEHGARPDEFLLVDANTQKIRSVRVTDQRARGRGFRLTPSGSRLKTAERAVVGGGVPVYRSNGRVRRAAVGAAAVPVALAGWDLDGTSVLSPASKSVWTISGPYR